MYKKPWLQVDHSFIGDKVTFKRGRTSFVCWGAFINGEVNIGDGVLISPNSTIISSVHGIEPGIHIKDQKTIHKPITIGSGVWIGAGATILGGNVIEDGAVIGAGSVLTEDNHVGKNEVWVGNPCKFLRYR